MSEARRRNGAHSKSGDTGGGGRGAPTSTANFARPKSQIFTEERLEASSSIRFSSLMSRCTIPCECRYSMPLRTCGRARTGGSEGVRGRE